MRKPTKDTFEHVGLACKFTFLPLMPEIGSLVILKVTHIFGVVHGSMNIFDDQTLKVKHPISSWIIPIY
jgi:hypothetical protein